MAAPTCSVVRLGSAKRWLRPLRNSAAKKTTRARMPALPSIAARQGSRSRKAQTESARQTSSEVPAAIRKRATRRDCRSSRGGNTTRALSLPTSAPDRTSLIATPFVQLLRRSVFYRQRIERAPEVPARDRAPRPPAFGELAHAGEGDFPALEVADADPLLHAEIVDRKHVRAQQVEHQ